MNVGGRSRGKGKGGGFGSFFSEPLVWSNPQGRDNCWDLRTWCCALEGTTSDCASHGEVALANPLSLDRISRGLAQLLNKQR